VWQLGGASGSCQCGLIVVIKLMEGTLTYYVHSIYIVNFLRAGHHMALCRYRGHEAVDVGDISTVTLTCSVLKIFTSILYLYVGVFCCCCFQLKSDLKKTEEDLAVAKGEAESVVKERHEKV